MDNPTTQDATIPALIPAQIPDEQPIVVAKLLDSLPGLIGSIDYAIRDRVGQPMPFVLLIFSGNNCAHAQNFDAKMANELVRSFAASLEKEDAAAVATGEQV